MHVFDVSQYQRLWLLEHRTTHKCVLVLECALDHRFCSDKSIDRSINVISLLKSEIIHSWFVLTLNPKRWDFFFVIVRDIFRLHYYNSTTFWKVSWVNKVCIVGFYSNWPVLTYNRGKEKIWGEMVLDLIWALCDSIRVECRFGCNSEPCRKINVASLES